MRYCGVVFFAAALLSGELYLKAAIRGRQPSIKIDEYNVFGEGSVAVHRSSRPPRRGSPE